MRAAFAALILLAGCTKKPASRLCMDVTPVTTSASTRAVFERRECQGGGVTWAGLLRVLAKREGAVEPDYTLDDEGDAARFCGPATLVERLRGEVVRLNADPKALELAMSETTALELECEGLDGELRALDPVPPVPPEEQARRAERLKGLESALAKQRTWCWPRGSITRNEGALRFESDGGVTLTALDGGVTAGRWNFEPEGRLQVAGQGLHHFDVEDSGVLSTHFVDGLRADGSARVVVEPLVPGPVCPSGVEDR